MKRADIKVGEFYAVARSSGKYRQQGAIKCRVIDTKVDGLVRGGTARSKIHVEPPADSALPYGLYLDGQGRLLVESRQIISEWLPYEAQKAARDAARAARVAERARLRAAAEDVEARLVALGVAHRAPGFFGHITFTFTLDEMLAVVERLEAASADGRDR